MATESEAPELHVFFDGDGNWYVGESLDQVKDEVRKQIGDEVDTYDWVQLLDDGPLAGSLTEDGPPVTKTCAEWIKIFLNKENGTPGEVLFTVYN